jgi:hypothetical protein
MVDISSQEKKINIKIQSGGVQANVGVTQDTAQYYSEKAREWAISNRIVDGVDYSSKYYAGKANESAVKVENSLVYFFHFVYGVVVHVDPHLSQSIPTNSYLVDNVSVGGADKLTRPT